jgi:cytochrome c oxidase cbb3-type subunit 3
MPAFADLLSREEIRDVALFIKAWSEPEVLTPADAERAAAGEQAYLDNCAACHGEDGAGEQALGAPALNDSIWLYGGSIEQIEAQIRRPRHGVMPAFVDRLSAETIKMLAVYVHSLGGGVIDTAEPDG